MGDPEQVTHPLRDTKPLFPPFGGERMIMQGEMAWLENKRKPLTEKEKGLRDRQLAKEEPAITEDDSRFMPRIGTEQAFLPNNSRGGILKRMIAVFQNLLR